MFSRKALKNFKQTGAIEIGRYSLGIELGLPIFNKGVTLPYLQQEAKESILANLQRTTETLGAIKSAVFIKK